MAPTREERFLMRQRGAGARQLRNSGFDFAIPGVSASSSKIIGSGRSRRTPQSALQAQPSSKRTPKAPSHLAQRSSRRTPATSNSQQSGPHQVGVEVSSRDRNDPSILKSSETRNNGSITRKRKSERLLQGAKLSTPVEEKNISRGQEEAEKPVSETLKLPNGGEAGIHAVYAQLDKSAGASSKKRKKRRSIGQNSRKRIKTSIPDATILAPSVLPLATSTITEDSEKRARTLSPDRDHIEHGPDAVPQIGLVTKRKRKKRKSIAKRPRVKRQPLDTPSSMVQNLENATGEESLAITPVSRKVDGDQLLVEEFEDESEHISPANREKQIVKGLQIGLSSSPQPRKRGRPKKSDISRPSLSSQAATKPSTSHLKPFKRAIHPVSSFPTDHRDKLLPRARADSIPITVHRITHFPIGSPSSAEGDIISDPPTFPKRGSVNAIDVLSQICREVVGKTVESLQLAEAKERGERQRIEQHKREVIELYGFELDSRLFQMTETLDDNYALTVRLRQAKKDKVALGRKLFEIKQQREEIAVDTDEVRVKHDRFTQIAQSEDDLDTIIEDLELAVQRGRAQQQAPGKEDDEEGEVGLELSLQSVAEKVSSVGRLGLLERVKSFNALIETVTASI